MPIRDWSFFLVIATILLTPGPTNTLLATAGIQAGLRHSWRLIPAECLGYLIATTIWGALLEALVREAPWLMLTVQLLSALYLTKLGWNLWTYASLRTESSHPPTIARKQLFLATLLNPKAVIFALTLFPAQTWMSAGNYVSVMGGFSLLVACIGSLWITFGAMLMGGRVSWLQPRHVQRCASLVLWGFAMWLLFRVMGF